MGTGLKDKIEGECAMPETGHFVIEDSAQAFEFDGVRLAGPVSSRLSPRTGLPRPRWLVMTLYRTQGGVYVLYRVNRSVVFHELEHPCDRSGKAAPHWKQVPVEKLPPGAVPCSRAVASGRRCCYPDLGDATVTVVLAEQPYYTIDRLPDPAAVIRRLSEAKHRRSGFISDVVSRPMQELLAQAAENDPGFRGPKPVTRIA